MPRQPDNRDDQEQTMSNIAYGVSKSHSSFTDWRRFRFRRWIGWAQNVLASDGAFKPSRPYLFRFRAKRRAGRIARAQDPQARPATAQEVCWFDA